MYLNLWFFFHLLRKIILNLQTKPVQSWKTKSKLNKMTLICYSLYTFFKFKIKKIESENRIFIKISIISTSRWLSPTYWLVVFGRTWHVIVLIFSFPHSSPNIPRCHLRVTSPFAHHGPTSPKIPVTDSHCWINLYDCVVE